LVAITPACANLTPGWSIVLGVLVGALCALAINLKFALGFDDSLDVVGIHLVGGIVGTLFLGFFANETGLLFSGDFGQLITQAIAAGGVLVYSFVASLLLGILIEKTIGFRASTEAEIAGIDTVVHGELGYAITE
jgi:Amt family ammonium transporter